MLKVMGCVLIFVSCCGLGFLKSAGYRARSSELEDIIDIIKLLELEITYRKETLSKAFRKAAQQKPCWFSAVLQSCSIGLKERLPLDKAWAEAIEAHEACAPLEKKDLDVLQDMALGLGRSDTDGQSRLLEPVTIRIQTCLADAKHKEEKLGRMYKGLGISSGIIIVIMII